MAGHSGFSYNRICKEKCLADREKGGRSVEKLLDIQHMMKYYGNKSSLTKAVDDISFSVEKGEFTAVMGASGSGKTTLLNCISTIDRVTGGHILVEGKDVTRLRGRGLSKFRREKLGFIFQDFNLLDTLNGFDNIALALQIQNEKPARIPGRVEDMAKKLNIREVLKKYPYQMSGGQKQRCACARAMITNPSLILADEPTGALDSQSAGMLLDNLQFLNRELGATILMVTHDPLCASYSGRVLFLKDGKLFHELRKGEADRKGFFDQIIHVIALLGGDLNHVV
ncbi:MAG TPA: ABC transporter ATP-binding protein [Candidatus Blautia stercoripullorum]|uniref:ABC transporter ATP-binding protein n=1 Tax=Candidatus Blautia stercoripullorum TaxID=2838502 RepID=A0A9D2U2U6_9FIRM|nr:ABC transporter ATP-binding protein [Candidatus Blautia stercoripullorum]